MTTWLSAPTTMTGWTVADVVIPDGAVEAAQKAHGMPVVTCTEGHMLYVPLLAENARAALTAAWPWLWMEAIERGNLRDDLSAALAAAGVRTPFTVADRILPTVLAHIEAASMDASGGSGEEDHPDGNDRPHERNIRVFPSGCAKDQAEAARWACQRATAEGNLTWRDILLEKVHAALAEDDPAQLRTKLIRVAGSATRWVKAIDRRQGADHG